jgi:hypothetical protein
VAIPEAVHDGGYSRSAPYIMVAIPEEVHDGGYTRSAPYMMVAISEARRVHSIIFLHFHYAFVYIVSEFINAIS